MIFFTEEIKPFRVKDYPHVISPIACELKNGEKGYYLGVDMFQYLAEKVSTVKTISKEDVQTEELE